MFKVGDKVDVKCGAQWALRGVVEDVVSADLYGVRVENNDYMRVESSRVRPYVGDWNARGVKWK